MMTKKIITALLLGCSLLSCNNSSRSLLKGVIANAPAGATLYLQREGLDKQEILDSVTLTKNGSFSVAIPSDSVPEFYTVRCGSGVYWIASDSAASLHLNAVYNDSKNYKVDGTKALNDIYAIQQTLFMMEDSVNLLIDSVKAGRIERDSLLNVAYSLVSNYKDSAKCIIQKSPSSVSAYYVLFKKANLGIPIFDAYNPDDYHYFALVANAWNKKYPESLRTKQLKNLLLDAKNKKTVRNANLTEKAKSTGFIDISLPNRMGEFVSLSSLKGKDILLQFCLLAQLSDEVIANLKTIYKQYSSKNFDIYMVCYDKNPKVWRDKTKDFPWITVLDYPENTFKTYNLKLLPTNFLIDSDGDLRGRDLDEDMLVQYLKSR